MITWQEASAEVKENPKDHIEQYDMLRVLVVFDAWIANIDRASGKNLVLYRNAPVEKYKWYLIDHGHTLYGSPRKWKQWKWNAPIWDKLWVYYHVPQGLLKIQNSRRVLEPMIRKIESFPTSKIDAALKAVPNGHLRKKERKFIKRLLVYRKRKLRTIMMNWLRYKGQKENGS